MTEITTPKSLRPPVRLSWGGMRAVTRDRIDWMLRASVEQGAVAHFKFMGLDIFFVADPDVIRELIVRRPGSLHRDPFTSNVLRRVLGQGVFTAEDEDWQQQRKLVAPAFHAMRVRTYAENMAHYTREMTDRWREGDICDLDKELTQLTLRIIAKTMFNVDLLEEANRIGGLTDALLKTTQAQLDMSFPPPVWLPTPINRRQNAALKELRALLRDIIRERVASGRDEGDLLSMLVRARDESGRPMSESQIIDECATLMFAGHETTAVSLMWTWLLLLRHPEVAARLYEEIDGALHGEPVTFEQLAALPYSEMIVKEAMRLYPPAYSFGRSPQEDIEFEVDGDRYYFKKGSTIIISTMAMHRLPEYFPEPESFRPERWAVGEPQPPKYAYLPFGAGPRVCLGNMFAMMEAQVILATMVQHVRFVPEQEPNLTWDPLLTLHPRGPMRFLVNCRPHHADRSSGSPL